MKIRRNFSFRSTKKKINRLQNENLTTNLKADCLLARLSASMGPFGGDGLEPGLYAGDAAPAVTSFALEEKQARIFLQVRLGRFARVTRDVFLNVFPEHGFDMFLLKATFND